MSPATHSTPQSPVALITGAKGGIGLAIALRLAKDGYALALNDLAFDDPSLQALADAGASYQLFAGDLADPPFCDTLPLDVFAEYGRLDALCNNAGVIARGTVVATNDAQLRSSLAINVEAPFRLCRSAIPLMAEAGGGAIVNTASCWGLRPGADHALYCMTKAALASLTQCMGRDHAPQNIRVNAVCPNEVDTAMLRSGFAARGLDVDTAIDALNQSVPLGRIAQPEDIADAVAYLLSDQARYVCGALLEVNGGKAVQ